MNDYLPPGPVGVMVTASSKGKIRATRETPRGDRACDQLTTREGQVRPRGVADGSVVCAGQREGQEGSSPSGARMRSAVSKSGSNVSLAGG